MSKFSLILASIGLLISYGTQAAEEFEKENKCYRALISFASGANYDLENGTILIPGVKNKTRGFYIYTDRMSYFCQFPQENHESTAQADYYYLDLKIADKDRIYVTYSDMKNTPSNPGLGISLSPSEALEGKYTTPKCGESLNSESRKLLQNELKARISTVKSTFDIYARDQRYSRPKEKYIEALNACKAVGGEVKALAESETLKFESISSLGKPKTTQQMKAKGLK